MTSSTKPEVNNVSQRCQSTINQQAAHTENLVKFRQTDIADISTDNAPYNISQFTREGRNQ